MMAASGFWPLFKPESSWGQAASHTCPGSSSAPLMLHLSEPRLCLPCTTHLLIVCWLKGWSRKCNSTHPTWSPGHPHVGDADWCPSAIHLISPSCVPALTEAVGTEANAGLVTVPKEGTSGTSQVSVTQGSIADLPSFLHLFCLFVFLVLKGRCSGCWLQWEWPGRPWGANVRTWLSLGAFPQTCILHPSGSQTQHSLPFLAQSSSWCIPYCRDP